VTIQGRLVIRTNYCRSLTCKKMQSYISRNCARLFLPCSQRAAQRIDDAPFHLVHDLLGKILKSERTRVISELMSKRFLHETENFNLPMNGTRARNMIPDFLGRGREMLGRVTPCAPPS